VEQRFGKGFEAEDGANTSPNPHIQEVSGERRHLIKACGAAVALLVGSHSVNTAWGEAGRVAQRGHSPLGFTRVPVSSADSLRVPQEYIAQVLYRWGDATGIAGQPQPAFHADASNSWQDQLLQAGMHHDGMEYFPLSKGHGLLALNHEYTDDGLLHRDGMKTWSADKVRKAQAAHGVSVIEIRQTAGTWAVNPASSYARRITALTPMTLSGPAAGHVSLQTQDDPSGRRVLGTLNNCAAGRTPWGTYLTCEENWNGYFSSQAQPTADEKRYGLRPGGWGYRWHEHDARFNASSHPHEPNRFGWVVEIDPMDPTHTPVKRTALGRFKHEGATTALRRDGRVVVYMGDDERFEYVYKFVSRDPVKSGGFAANRDLLDHGTLYVGRFDALGHGRWLPLVHGEHGLTAADGFHSQADVLVRCRQAADAVGATKMDRPEWIAVHPDTGEVFVTLTNNSLRGAPGRTLDEQVQDANPRADNVMGHIVRWREGEGDTFRWMHFSLAGDPSAAKPDHRGNVKGDLYGSPDGLRFDPSGLLWIQTDISTSAMHKGPYEFVGNNMMLVADPATGETKRFMTGPVGCEITGLAFTPDRSAVFVNIQHPGEPSSERSDPDRPQAISQWPDGPSGGRPRSATVVIRRQDGGPVGT